MSQTPFARRRSGLVWNQALWLVLGLVLAGNAAAADLTPHLRTITAGQYRITYWTSEQGLPQNTVTCLLQARNGYLWIGTRYGLTRYDGVRFTHYTTPLASGGDDDLDIRCLAEDKQGHLCFATRTHLIEYHEARFQRFALSNAPFAGPVMGLCAGRTGGFWVAREGGVFFFDGRETGASFGVGRDLCKPLPPNQGKLDGMVADPQGKLWIRLSAASSATLWQQWDPASSRALWLTNVVGPVPADIGGLCPGPDGRLWLARPGELLCWEAGRLSHVDASGAWGAHKAEELVQDALGNLWVRSSGPVQLHRYAEGRFSSYGRPEGLTADDLRSLCPDREGNLWVGTGMGGLFQVQPRQLVSLLAGSASAMSEIYSICPGKQGRVWLSTSYGLVKYQAGDFTIYTNLNHVNGGNMQRARTVWEHSSGQVFVGLDFEGLYTLRDGRYVSVPGIPPIEGERRLITSLAEDSQGNLWIACPRGLARWQPDAFRLWTTADGLLDDRIFGLVCAPDGAIWVGTDRSGINEFKAGQFHTYSSRDGLLHDHAWPLRAEPDGSVWVGTPAGLNRIRHGRISAVTMSEGLFDNLAYCLLDDSGSNYWSFGNRGIWRVKQGELHAVADGRASRVHCVSYGEANGMVSAEGNGDEQPNAAQLPNGELWFPTTRGVVIMNPKRLREDKVPPPVVIEEVRVDNQVIYRDGGYPNLGGLRRPAGGVVRLPPGSARVVEIHYTANTFFAPDKTRFHFRLTGNHSDWREADTRREAVYTNLRPGSYRFLVEACNHDGYWSERPAEFAFVLAPYFYQTWPFDVICTLVGASALGGWYLRRQSMQRRVHRLQQARALEAERNRIARDLHDDLGANLTALALQIELAGSQGGSPPACRGESPALADSIRAVAARVREIIWSLNPQCDTIEHFCAYLCQYTESFLASAGLRCRLDLPEERLVQPLSAEVRHNLLLIAKEALNNVVRHAAATEVSLSVTVDAQSLVLAVTDNGRGFSPARQPDEALPVKRTSPHPDPAPPPGGQGLGNMRRRAEALGGTFVITGDLGSGTRIIVRIPLRSRE